MKNFESVIKTYQIQIPIIQRDYAQGRGNSKATEIRNVFLNSIAETLNDNKPLHLDFIYGSIKGNKFIPLDGQQRLTTLFLLHWYFGKKEGLEVGFLNNFTYETRASSREFCNNLVSCKIDFSNDFLSDQIIDSNWFLAFWESDPTIQSMLIMLDAIHNKFKEEAFYGRLKNISFNFFELNDFGLDDDLYIKMNARGKSLTDFENFKAKFEQHLEILDESLKEEFALKIDNEWTDFFWPYCVADGSYVVDDFIANYIQFITEMIYYKQNGKPLAKDLELNEILGIYSNKENCLFLFQSFDKLRIIYQSFDQIFSKNGFEEGKVCLFDDSINLLEKVITGRPINIQQSIFLFIIINHLNKYDLNSTLADLLRVIRNLTSRIRHLKRGEITYTNDLTFEHLPAILKLSLALINKSVYDNPSYLRGSSISGSGITKTSLEQEVLKLDLCQNNSLLKRAICELEDFYYLKGDIHNFIGDDHSNLEFYSSSLRSIFKADDSDIIRALLTIGDYSLDIGWTQVGNKYFFGKKNYWEIILTSYNNGSVNYYEFFEKFLANYKTCNESLSQIIKVYLKDNNEKNWQYYFVKYEPMTKQGYGLSKDNNIYAWVNNFEIEKMGGSNLNAYHLNPYVNTVSDLSGVPYYMMQGHETSYLLLDEISFEIIEEGWRIFGLKEELHSPLIAEFKLIVEAGYFILKETKSKDRVQILVSLIKKLKEQVD